MAAQRGRGLHMAYAENCWSVNSTDARVVNFVCGNALHGGMDLFRREVRVDGRTPICYAMMG